MNRLPATQQPAIQACLQHAPAVAALVAAGYDVQQVECPEQLATANRRRPPRLFVLEDRGADRTTVAPVVERLRQDWPLTDIVIWAPDGSSETVRRAFLWGARDVVVANDPQQLVDSVRAVVSAQQILPRVQDLSRQRTQTARFESLLSRSSAMWDLFDLCTRVASSDATVLILGETGTGKDLLARAVHRRSQRPGRFVAANCASISRELITSELFGHEKGAFTGAVRAKRGLVRHAHRGTLFLDEIGDMPTETQLSLLRLLQEKRVRPVGGQHEMEVDVRIVAATHVSLEDAVAQGEFREDLFYRLDVIRMNVPPLRTRPEDILFLFGHFVKRLAKHYGLAPPTFSDGFLQALTEFDWPGNVRQLENLTERLVLSRTRRVLGAPDFPRFIQSRPTTSDSPRLRQPPPAAATAQSSLTASLDVQRTLAENVEPWIEQREAAYLRAVLDANAGRIADSAQQAGISRRTLLRKLQQYGIDKRDYKRRGQPS